MVRALLFWPAILGTAANANEAIAAADTRKAFLANQMTAKNCALPTAGMPVVDTKPAGEQQVTASSGPSKEVQLTELKRLFDAKLINQEAYNDRQKSILAAP